MLRHLPPLAAVLILCAVCLLCRPALAAHGVSIDGTLKYPAEFSRFAYVDPAARQGGSLTLHDLGSFDKMNPFTLKGNGPAGLTRYVSVPLRRRSGPPGARSRRRRSGPA